MMKLETTALRAHRNLDKFQLQLHIATTQRAEETVTTRSHFCGRNRIQAPALGLDAYIHTHKKGLSLARKGNAQQDFFACIRYQCSCSPAYGRTVLRTFLSTPNDCATEKLH
jgi:hypothetical protein